MKRIKTKTLVTGVLLPGVFLLVIPFIVSDPTYSQIMSLKRVAVTALFSGVLVVMIHTVFRFEKRRKEFFRRSIAMLCAAVLMIPVPLANAEMSISLDVTGLTFEEALTKTEPNGTEEKVYATASWEGSGTKITGTLTPGYAKTTTTSTNNCGNATTTVTYGYSSGDVATLTLKNTSGAERLLTFDFTMPTHGSLKIGGTEYTVGGHYEKTLASNGTLSIVLTGRSLTGLVHDEPDAATYAATTTLSNIQYVDTAPTVNVTLESVVAVDGAAPGSYTVKGNSTALAVGQTYTKSIGTTYTFTATPNSNYIFTGWYLNDAFVSDQATLTDIFVEDTTVKATFAVDPLYAAATLAEGGTGTKDQYVSIWSEYSNNLKKSYTRGYGLWNNTHDQRYLYFEDPAWNAVTGGIQSTMSGTSNGDMQTELGRSTAYAYVYSDIIRIKAEKNCIITFNYDMKMAMASGSTIKDSLALIYCISSSASASVSTISGGTKIVNVVDAEGSSGATITGAAEITVPAGQYLYLYAYGIGSAEEYKSSNYHTTTYDYSAKITDFTVTPNEEKCALDAGIRDNTGKLLNAGSIKVNGTASTVNKTTADITQQTHAAGTALTLTPGTAPSGYTFLRWHCMTLDKETGSVTAESYVYEETCPITLDKNTRINAIYVPIMTITMGDNGITDASYSYTSIEGTVTASDGQFVARNSDCTAFYTTLQAGFEDTDAVFLLASHTFDGDFEIPDGETLVIPYGIDDMGNNVDKDGNPIPPQTEKSTSLSGYYCTATLNGKLTVNGTLIVNGQQSGYNNGRPGGLIGRLNLTEDASVTVNGTLYAYGLVKGYVNANNETMLGQITATETATIHELMEIKDMRGVVVLGNIVERSGKGLEIFPFSHFYFKSIEGSVRYETGAKLQGMVSVLLQGATEPSTASLPLIGSSGSMFNLTKGCITKTYDIALDQTIISVDKDAEATTGTFGMKMVYSYAGFQNQEVTLNTADFYLPLEANFNIQIAGNLTLNDKYKLLPGAVLNVTESGVLTVASGAEIVAYRLNDYDIRTPGSGYVCQGFSSQGAVVNATRYPSIKYPLTRTKDTVGSAKVNVDGTVTVLGGLYVTSETEGTEPLNAYDNGNNVLTGIGTINMNNAGNSIAAINEAMQCQSSNEPEYVAVTVVPIKGLPVDAAEDNPDLYNSLTDDIYYGVQKNDFYVWATNRMQFFDGDTLQYVAATSDGAKNVNADGTLFVDVVDANGTDTSLGAPLDTNRVGMGWKVEGGTAVETADQIKANAFSKYGDDVKLYAVYAVAQIVDKDGPVTDTSGQPSMRYETLEGAVAAYNNISDSEKVWYIQMLESVTEDYTIPDIVYLDLNGKKVTVEDISGTLYGMDQATDGYCKNGERPGTLVLTGTDPNAPQSDTAGTETTGTPKDTDSVRYAYLTAGNATDGYTFNRFDITVTDYYLEVDARGGAKIGYAAAFQGNSNVAAALNNMGMTILASSTTTNTDGTEKVTVHASTTEWGTGEIVGNFDNVVVPYKGYCTIPVIEFVAEETSIKHYGDYSAKGLLKFGDDDSTAVIWESRESDKINFKSVLETYYTEYADPDAQRVIEEFRDCHTEQGLNLVKKQ